MGLEYAEKEKGMFEAKWVWAKGNDLWALGELNHKQNDKNNRNFRGVGVCFVGWSTYPFIVMFREVLISKSPKCRTDQEVEW